MAVEHYPIAVFLLPNGGWMSFRELADHIGNVRRSKQELRFHFLRWLVVGRRKPDRVGSRPLGANSLGPIWAILRADLGNP